MSRWLLLGLLAGGPAWSFDWNVPKLEAWTQVGDTMVVNGLPMKLYAARSRWKLQDLLQHYVDRFEGERFFLPRRRHQRLAGLELPSVMALDTETGWSYLVYGFPEPDGSTTLILGAADNAHRLPRGAANAPWPVFPGGQALFVSNVEVGRMMHFRVSAPQAEVADFYRQTLTAGGWTSLDGHTFEQGQRSLRLLLQPGTKGLEVTLLEDGQGGAQVDRSVLKQARAALDSPDASVR